MSKQIAFFVYRYLINISPSIINSIEQLAEDGYSVDIFINRKSWHPSLEFKQKNVNLYLINDSLTLHALAYTIKNFFWQIYSLLVYRPLSLVKSLFNKIILPITKKNLFNLTYFAQVSEIYLKKVDGVKDIFGIYKYIKYIDRHLYRHILAIKKNIRDKIYDYYWGVEPLGLIIARIIKNDIKSGLIYLNLELLNSAEITDPYLKIIKKFERICNKDAIMTIVQDRNRADILVRDNYINYESIRYLPVSFKGPTVREKTDYLKARFGIPKQNKIILYAGYIYEWSRCYELASSASKWKKEYVLVIHGFCLKSEEWYINKIKHDFPQVYISQGILRRKEFDSLVASADIGVAFYKGLGYNFLLAGNASGKLAQYLKCGLPVICSDYDSFRQIIEKYQIGKCTDNFDSLENLIGEINANYNVYRQNAFRCFNEQFEISLHFKNIIKDLKNF